MATAQTTSNAASGFSTLPVARQIGVLIGFAASVAIGFAVVLWAIEPSYTPLYHNLNSREASQVLDSLTKAGIEYKLDKKKGSILVPTDDLHDARLKLAAEGLPRGNGSSFQFLGKNSGFGNSQFMEVARYRHALEQELAKTIGHFNEVKSARVHLAIPKRFKSLVKDAIGFNAQRGDSVNIVNTSFASVPEVEALPTPSFWQQGWFHDLVKQVIGGLFVLFIVFGVLRPLLRNLATKAVPQNLQLSNDATNSEGANNAGGQSPGQLPGSAQGYENSMQIVQNMAGTDPQRVAQVVKAWVAE